MGQMSERVKALTERGGLCGLDISVQFETWKFSHWNVVRHMAMYLARPGLIIFGNNLTGNNLKEKQGNFAWSKKPKTSDQ